MKSAKDILAAKIRKPVPWRSVDGELDGFLKIWSGTDGGEWNIYNQTCRDKETGQLLYPDVWRAKLIQLCYCDENGALAFQPDQVQQIPLHVSNAAIEECFAECARINRLSTEEVERARAAFLATKPSETGSDSHGSSDSTTLKG